MNATNAMNAKGPRFPLAVRAGFTVIATIAAVVCGAVVSAALSRAPVAGSVAGSCAVALTALLLAVVLVRHVDRRPVKALRLDRAALRACLAGLALVAGTVVIATVVAAGSG